MAIRRWTALALFLGLLLGVTGARAETGSNWSASFYNNMDLSGTPALVQTGLPALNFTWGAGSPGAGVNTDQFSARFTGAQSFAGGNYEFVVTSDDGVRVIIDGITLLDRFVARAQTTDRFTTTLTAGTHNITVEYFENSDQAMLRVEWFLVGQPGSQLPPPVVTPTPSAPVPPPIPEGALTATVIRAPVLLLRSAPWIGSDVLGRIRRGETYQVIGRNHDARWFVLQLADKQAWAYGYYLFVNGNEFTAPHVSSYILEGNPAQHSGIVGQAHQGLRLRSAPSVDAEQIGRITWGDVMAILGKTHDGVWYQVIYKDTPGWVISGYMRVVEGDEAAIPVTG